jgi:L-gulonolactone oxidase
MATWVNWAGNQRADGITIEHPQSTEDVATLVRKASESGKRVKAIGAGHSFTGIAEPEDIQVDLGHLSGLFACDRRTGTVMVGAGTTLRRLNDVLARVGLALTNLGDIDSQSIAGAISTGTHGTGITYGGIATQVIGLEVVLADGSVVNCSADERRDLWSAARVGLGALGILTRVSLRCVPLFSIRAEERPMPLDELLIRLDELTANYDHFEAYWFPHTDATSIKCNTRLPLVEGLDRLKVYKEWFDDEFLANGVFGLMVAIGKHRPSLIPAANRLASRAGSRTFTDLSYKVFTSPRRVRFKEMELALPREAAGAAIRDVVAAIESSDMKIGFPVEIRVAAGDDIPLSTASGRQSAYLAFHIPASLDHEQYFKLVSRVLDSYGTRPHWGKLHDFDAEILRTRYPHFDKFVRLRDDVDPTGTFSNPYLDRVLGPVGEVSGV